MVPTPVPTSRSTTNNDSAPPKRRLTRSSASNSSSKSELQQLTSNRILGKNGFLKKPSESRTLSDDSVASLKLISDRTSKRLVSASGSSSLNGWDQSISGKCDRNNTGGNHSDSDASVVPARRSLRTAAQPKKLPLKPVEQSPTTKQIASSRVAATAEVPLKPVISGSSSKLKEHQPMATSKQNASTLKRSPKILARDKEKIERLIKKRKHTQNEAALGPNTNPEENPSYFTSIFTPNATVTRSKSKNGAIQLVKVNPVGSRNKTPVTPIECPVGGQQDVGGVLSTKTGRGTTISNNYPALLSPNGTSTINISVECKTRKSFSELDMLCGETEESEGGSSSSSRLRRRRNLLTSNNVFVALDVKPSEQTSFSPDLQKIGPKLDTDVPRVASITIESGCTSPLVEDSKSCDELKDSTSVKDSDIV